jgi:hypothetical protein
VGTFGGASQKVAAAAAAPCCYLQSYGALYNATPNMIFSVTYCLELCNAMSNYIYASHILPTNVKSVFGHYRTLTTSLGKKVFQQ